MPPPRPLPPFGAGARRRLGPRLQVQEGKLFFVVATKRLLSYSCLFNLLKNEMVVCLLLAPVRENRSQRARQKWRQKKNRAFLDQDELPVHLAVGGDRGVLRRPLHDDAGEDSGGGDSQGMIEPYIRVRTPIFAVFKSYFFPQTVWPPRRLARLRPLLRRRAGGPAGKARINQICELCFQRVFHMSYL